MQERLASAIPTQETTGVFGSETLANVEAFQTAHGIAASGIVEATTWAALLALPPSPSTGRAPDPATDRRDKLRKTIAIHDSSRALATEAPDPSHPATPRGRPSRPAPKKTSDALDQTR